MISKARKGISIFLILLAAILVSLTFFVLSISSPQNTAYAGKITQVKMGYFEYGSMCMGAEEGAVKSGYVYDVMQKISSYTGWEYNYDYGTFAEEYIKLKNGEIDILPYTNWNEDRDKEVLFTSHAIVNEQYYLATRPGDTELNNNVPNGLNDKKIASVIGADQNSLLLEYFDKYSISPSQLIFFGTPEESWDALENGDVDAAVFSNISYRSNVNWNVFCTFGSKPTYIAVAKGREDLVEKLDNAFDEINQTDTMFFSQLEDRIYSGNPAVICLSEKEKNWILVHKAIRFGYIKSDSVNYAEKVADNQYIGFLSDLVSSILSKLKVNVNVEYHGYSTPEEMGEAVIKKEIDCAYPLFPSYSSAESYSFAISNSLPENSMAVVHNTNISYNDSMKKVAVRSSSISRYYLQSYYPNCEIIQLDKIEDIIKALRKGTVTGFVGNTAETSALVRSLGGYSSTILSQGCETCFAASLENSELIVLLNRGISIISNDEMSALFANNMRDVSVYMPAYIATHSETLALVILIPIALASLIIGLISSLRLRRKSQLANEAKTKFLFNMSHDIRTPMNAILGYTDIALNHESETDKVDDSLKKIKIAGGHLLNLINDILEMSRIEAGKLELVNSPLDIREAIDGITEMSKSLAITRDINYETRIGEIKSPYIFADALHLDQVIINLISNAIKYTEAGGNVEFYVNQIDDTEGNAKYEFIIKDNGIGMSEEFQEHLFENFSRESTATASRREGTGLGLSIVKKIIDLSNGTIQVQSKKGMGSTFTVTMSFKVMNDKEIEDYEAENAKKGILVENTSFDGKRVLVVEDNEMNREIAVEILSQVEFEVETAADGSIAVDMIKSKGIDYYDFVLMDIQMPVMNGYEATKAIRDLFPGASLPIIALSANAFQEDIKISLDAGMNAHIAKPIDINVLLETLAQLSK